MIHLFNQDCLEGMKDFPDKFFELAIVDPPYGIGEDGASNHSRCQLCEPKKYSPKKWDRSVPDTFYFQRLKIASKNRIIWGANHFINKMPIPSSCWIVWDKVNYGCDFADCELAWTSFNTAIRKFTYQWNGMLQGNMKNKEIRIHPTQKPVALYKWLLKNYAKPGDKILDTHGGSMSIAIACHDMGFDLWLYELDPDYFKAGKERLERHQAQMRLF